MSVAKSSFKTRRETAFELGEKAEDIQEASARQVHEFAGARAALMEAQKSVEELLLAADELEPEYMKVAKTHILRCSGAIGSLAKKAEVNHYMAKGRVSAMEVMVKKIAFVHTDADAKLKSYEQAEDSISNGEEPAHRPVGMNPGLSIQQERALGLDARQKDVAPSKKKKVSRKKKVKRKVKPADAKNPG